MTEASPKVHWMGAVPPHWDIKALKFCAELISERVDGSTAGRSTYIGLEHIQGKTGRLVRTEGSQDSAESTVSCFRSGDVLFGKLRPYLAKAAVAESDGVCSSEILVYRPHKLMAPYLKHVMLLNGFIEEVTSSTYGSKMPRADASFISSLPVPQPPVEEQLAIGFYLDAETARIDDLIDAKTQLAQLIDEFRWSTLSQILGGQNRETEHVPTSSPFWMVRPSDWSELRVKFLVDRIEQGWSPQAESGSAGPEEWGVLKAGACNGGIFREEENKTLPVEVLPDSNLEIKPLDVLMSRGSGSVDLVGSVALVPTNVRPRLMLCDLMYRLTLNDTLALPDWFVLVMNAAQVRRQIRASLRGAEGLTRKISIGEINELVVLVPTLDEQRLLVDQCRAINERASSAIEHVTKEIELLQELRSATITDAVLGRIDVRDYMKN